MNLEKVIQAFEDPYLKISYTALEAVKIISYKKDALELEISLPYPIAAVETELRNILQNHFMKHGFGKIKLNLKQEIAVLNPRPNMSPVPNISPAKAQGENQAQTNNLGGVKNIIAVASGKGGVGKSTMSLHLARALNKIGGRVGILDADIYGPSQPKLLSLEANSKAVSSKSASPGSLDPIISQDGIKTMSLRYLLEDNKTPAIWRGPIASNVLQQMIFNTNWGNLDYLVIDMPPGTGDIQLTLCQKVSISTAVIITTPHQLAIIGAQKGIEMFRKLYVPVAGFIENMAYFSCDSCGQKHYPFGKDANKQLKTMNTKLLGQIPIEMSYSDADPTKLSVAMETMWSDIAFGLCIDMSKLKSKKLPDILVIDD